MNYQEAIEFLKRHKQAVLATIKADGRPQLTNVLCVYDADSLLISITETRAKYRNLVRDPRATILVQGDTFWDFIVVEGTAHMTRMPEALPLLRSYYEMASGGPHRNWAEYDETMARDRRVMLRLSLDHIYPLSR